nr:hypothetical protein [Tanacetum cinerariifolium]
MTAESFSNLSKPLPEAVFMRVFLFKGALLSDLDPRVLQSQILSIHSTKDFKSLSCKLGFWGISAKRSCSFEQENRVLSPEAKEAAATMEQRLELGSKLSDIVKTKTDAHALLDLYKNQGYILTPHNGKVCVILKDICTPQDMFKSMFHVSYLYLLEKNVGLNSIGISDDRGPGGMLQISLEYVEREFNHAKRDGVLAGVENSGMNADYKKSGFWNDKKKKNIKDKRCKPHTSSNGDRANGDRRVLIMYVSCGSLDIARKVFDEMSKKDFNSWAIMIAGYADNGEYKEVIRLFACGETMNVELGEQVHGWLMKSGYSDDLFVGSSLISSYGKVGCFQDGDMVFDQIGSRKNVVVWTARIINNCKEERFREVFEVFNEMGKVGVRKNSFTLSSVLGACSKISDDGNCGDQVHANAIKLGLASESYVQCGLVNMYGKCGLMNDAKRVFDMKEIRRNRACWNAMLTSVVQNGCLVEAIKFLYQMRAAGVQPQELWLNKLRSLCGSEVIEIK